MTDKITIERETLERAIAAIEPVSAYGRVGTRDVDQAAMQKAVVALRAALAAQPAEPVAWRWKERVNGMSDSDWTVTNVEPPDGVRVIAKEPLYAAQPADIANPISQQEPVAMVFQHGATVRLDWASVKAAHNCKPGPLYAAPPAQPAEPVQRLSDEQITLANYSPLGKTARPTK